MKERTRLGMLCGGIGIGLNTILFGIKLLAGIISNSIAITADAFNNLSDAGSSIIMLFGFKLADEAPDKDHPFGHGRIEYVSGLIVSVFILMVAFELFKSSVNKMIQPVELESSPLVVGILVVSVLIKLIMWIYNRVIGKKIESSAMQATATDSISDAVATCVVLIGTLVGSYTGFQIDGFLGALVAVFIFLAGFNAAKDTINPLLGMKPDEEFVKKIEEMVMSYDLVIGIHDLIVHNYGPGRILISLHAEVPSDGDLIEMHDVIDLIEHRLRSDLSCQAVIHMDPVCVHDEQTNRLREVVKEMVAEISGELSIHDFRIVVGPTHTNLVFDLLIPYRFSKSDSELVKEISERIHAYDESLYAVIEIDKE
ncbi:MAG: cation transporter [Lachnospiraceae bacterium]|nr:cation transporter [Lachnospiraceae bacterium]